MSTNNKHIRLFSDVFLVEGAKGALLISYGSKKMYEISASVAYVTKQFDQMPLSQLEHEFEEISDQLKSYFSFLTKNQLAFYTDSPDSFTAIDPNYESPSLIDNCIIEIGPKFCPDTMNRVLKELLRLGTSFLEIRSYASLHANQIKEYLVHLEGTTIMGIDLIIKYEESLTEKQLVQVALDSQRIASIYVHSAPEDKYIEDPDFVLNNDLGKIFYLTQQINSNACCGQISKASLSLASLPVFLHNQKANSCLNKKVAVDLDGNIKNCPSLPQVYGNIYKDSLYDIVKTKEISRYWNISKDDIDICKDCKFRYICTDCRAFVVDPDDIYSKPLKCGYNPYTDEWEDSTKMSEGIAAYKSEN